VYPVFVPRPALRGGVSSGMGAPDHPLLTCILFDPVYLPLSPPEPPPANAPNRLGERLLVQRPGLRPQNATRGATGAARAIIPADCHRRRALSHSWIIGYRQFQPQPFIGIVFIRCLYPQIRSPPFVFGCNNVQYHTLPGIAIFVVAGK